VTNIRSGFGRSGSFPDRRSIAMSRSTPSPRRVVFQYLVPVHVEVEDGIVGRVTIIDETPVRDPTVVDGDPANLADAVRAADDSQAWPSWQFGY
jgi:hypothetical protein